MLKDNEIERAIGPAYDPKGWNGDIRMIYPILCNNIVSSAFGKQNQDRVRYREQSVVRLKELLAIDSHVIFPERALRHSEHSIVWRHYLSLKSYFDSEDSKDFLLVLEDDVYPGVDAHKVYGLLLRAKDHGSDTYVDLADAYIPNRAHCSRTETIYFTRVGITRTASAYGLSRGAVGRILERFWPYSLPYDLHLQYLLWTLKVPGITSNLLISAHGSKDGSHTSSS